MIQSKNEITAKEMQREYLREWRRKNKDKVKKYQENYWQRKAEMEREATHGKEDS